MQENWHLGLTGPIKSDKYPTLKDLDSSRTLLDSPGAANPRTTRRVSHNPVLSKTAELTHGNTLTGAVLNHWQKAYQLPG